MVVASGAGHGDCLPAHVRIAPGVGGNADGVSPSHGVLLSPCHNHRSPRQRGRRPSDATPYARSRPDCRARLRFPPACEASRSAHSLRVASNHRHGPRPGRPAPRRSSRSHALSCDDDRSLRSAGTRDRTRTQARAALGHRAACVARGIPGARLPAAYTENASGTARSNFHRRRRRRCHPASDAARPHLTHRRRRPHLGRRFPTRLRRRCSCPLPVDAPHLPP